MTAKWLLDFSTALADSIAGTYTVDTVSEDGSGYVASDGSTFLRNGAGAVLGGSGAIRAGVTYGLAGDFLVSLVDWTCELSDTTGLSDDQAEKLKAAIVDQVGRVVSGSASL